MQPIDPGFNMIDYFPTGYGAPVNPSPFMGNPFFQRLLMRALANRQQPFVDPAFPTPSFRAMPTPMPRGIPTPKPIEPGFTGTLKPIQNGGYDPRSMMRPMPIQTQRIAQPLPTPPPMPERRAPARSWSNPMEPRQQPQQPLGTNVNNQPKQSMARNRRYY